jgi:hypothetical protein
MNKRQIDELVKYGEEFLFLNKEINGNECVFNSHKSFKDHCIDYYYSDDGDSMSLSFYWGSFKLRPLKYINIDFFDTTKMEFDVRITDKIINESIINIVKSINELKSISEEVKKDKEKSRISRLQKKIEKDKQTLEQLKGALGCSQ